jgi:hypothetical protein
VARSSAFARASRVAFSAALALGAFACGGGPKSPTQSMDRFNAALCPVPPHEDTSKPLDPNLDGVKADVVAASRTVTTASKLRLSLTFRNTGLHGVTISLPRQAFTLAGWSLVDHACVPVAYAQPPTAKALAYGNSGPMPLAIGESATIDTSIDDLAPGLALPPGIYAIRLALHPDASSPVVRERTILSDWTLFAVVPGK